MKRKILIFFVLFFSFLFFPLSKNQAQTITPSPKLTITPLTNNTTGFEVLVDLLKIILGAGGENNLPLNQNNALNPSTVPISINPSSFPDIQVTPDVNGLIYYSQCKGPYDNYPLPQGGTLCQAGCGPTTVSMILASYVDKNINPPLVVQEYRKNGYYLGPSGSYFFHAHNILKSYNLKIATIFADNQRRTIDQLMTQFGEIVKNYQKSGWTFFALANFCENGCGHYFWIIKIDQGGNTWAYDPYYGRLLPRPYNEKSRYPFPKYRVILGVKK